MVCTKELTSYFLKIALWEPGGRISVFLESSLKSITPNDMQITKSPFSLPVVIIRDGDVDLNAIKEINRTKDWLIDTLNNTYKADVNNILLATIDTNYNIEIYFKSK